MNSLPPQSSEPTGQDRPLERQKSTVSTGARTSATGRAEVGRGVEDSGPVHVKAHAMPLRYFGNLPHVGERKDGPAAPVMRVFKAHQLGGGHGEGDGAYGLLQAVQVHGPVGGVGDLAHDDAAQSRGAAHLVVVDMGLIPNR